MRVILVAMFVAILAACGQAPDASPGEQSPVKETGGQAWQEDCREEFEPLLDELDGLNSRLDIGLAYDEYGDYVGDSKVAYDRTSFEDLDQECIREVGIPLEEALNAYIKALNKWGDCIDSAYCDEPNIQPSWAEAADEIEEAKSNLEEMGS